MSDARLRAALPVAAPFGPDWGPATEQDNGPTAQFVVAYALAHCRPVTSYATGNKALDGPVIDPGYAALARSVPWAALDNNPQLGRTGSYQAQAVVAYAVPDAGTRGSTFAAVTHTLAGCRVALLPHATVTVDRTGTVPSPSGAAQFAAYLFTLGDGSGPAELGAVDVLDAGGITEVIAVTVAGSNAATTPDPATRQHLATLAADLAVQRIRASA